MSCFPTDLGWFGLLGSGRTVVRLTIGHSTADQVREDLLALRGVSHEPAGASIALAEGDWYPALRRALQDFTRGNRSDFADVEINLRETTQFRRRVLQLTRRIPYGKTLTYLDLAKRAGNPKAPRAVGAVMRTNPVPIIIPCHRVVATGGTIGGFTARQGVCLKQRMLELEGITALKAAR